MSDTLIKVENVSKKFCRSLKKSLWYGMQDLGNELLGRRHGGDGELRPEEFWAVKDVSFELKRGECLGLIGRNGAGKTTLLRMLNGLIKPDAGRIEMRGRVGALIALGAGFNPILTGRENIYVNASILGFSKKEIDKKLDNIIEFAELSEFIDSPVQHYSSGMFVRLGFSVAANFDPDILLVDEALAVGDLAFIVKCLNRVAELRRSGTCVIFVSHNELQVREAAQWCLLLNKGREVLFDSIDAAFLAYGNLIETPIPADPDAGFIHNGPVRVRYAGSRSNDPEGMLRTGQRATIILVCHAQIAMENADLELRFWNSMGQLMTTIRSSLANRFFHLPAGEAYFDIEIRSIALAPGRYRLAAGFRSHGAVLGWTRDLAYIDIFQAKCRNPSTGPVYHDATIVGPIECATQIKNH
ncbi:MAG TPA: polysaccharide ABC transporter ATP-binding protein [Candidatus Competibacter sp.]|nr:ATP-binding cassette domain-containing protein [Candidatus Competibacteraceae bacterium]HPE70711.1 polysaccharide ABC transporter ATP-binding protein [Candidatus Competibacter sp.]HRW64132.1 polysaccharide ABC transporter ATP-binding protein [Candidatus Competibacter sp.]